MLQRSEQSRNLSSDSVKYKVAELKFMCVSKRKRLSKEFFILCTLYVCIHAYMYLCHVVPLEVRGQLGWSQFSHHHVSTGDRTQVVRLVSKHLYPLSLFAAWKKDILKF